MFANMYHHVFGSDSLPWIKSGASNSKSSSRSSSFFDDEEDPLLICVRKPNRSDTKGEGVDDKDDEEDTGSTFFLQQEPVPDGVYKGIVVAILWKGIVAALWLGFKMYRSPYYTFGPSANLTLAFVNIPVDNWTLYIALMMYIVAQCIVQVYSGDLVYPWINAVVMNPGVVIQHDRWTAWGLTNLYWTVNCFNTIFFFALGLSQVDFALAIAVASSATGLYTSHLVIFDINRASNKNNNDVSKSVSIDERGGVGIHKNKLVLSNNEDADSSFFQL